MYLHFPLISLLLHVPFNPIIVPYLHFPLISLLFHVPFNPIIVPYLHFPLDPAKKTLTECSVSTHIHWSWKVKKMVCLKMDGIIEKKHMNDFQVVMNKEKTRVYPKCIRVSLRLLGQLSYEWTWGTISLCGNESSHLWKWSKKCYHNMTFLFSKLQNNSSYSRYLPFLVDWLESCLQA